MRVCSPLSSTFATPTAGELKNPLFDPTCTFTIPSDPAGFEIHLILEVTDQNKIVSPTDYRRIVITVTTVETGRAIGVVWRNRKCSRVSILDLG